jgi:hypothetical protein
MKTSRLILLSIFSIVLSIPVSAQTECKVLIPELSGNYIGKCKKGLANGKGKAIGIDTYEGSFKKGFPNGHGVYTWKTGAVYDGDWREGEGVYTFKYDGADSVQSGVWKDNSYLGPIPIKPKVITKTVVTRYNFRREGDGDRILIDLTLNGSPNKDIIDLTTISSSGTSFEMGRSIGFEGVTFPVLIKVSYITWNVAHTSRNHATFEFEIAEAGNWQVDVVN